VFCRVPVLFVSSDSMTSCVTSTTAVAVPTRQIDQLNVTDWPGARDGVLKFRTVETSVTRTSAADALAVPRFVTVTLCWAKVATTRSGRGTTIVHEWLACPVFPAASVARTVKACCPSPRRWYVIPLVHGAKAAPSSEHVNVAGSLAENVKLA
jgi:hypothetical protein